MKTGIVRRIDEVGRIVIPKEMRRALGLREGEPMEIGIKGAEIILTRYVDSTCTEIEELQSQIDILQTRIDNLRRESEPYPYLTELTKP